MSQVIGISPILFLFSLISATNFHSSLADIGPAAYYIPPYLPSACFGNDMSQFPTDNMFAAAGEGIWDNGASCGRSYLVRCISASSTTICDPSKTIQTLPFLSLLTLRLLLLTLSFARFDEAVIYIMISFFIYFFICSSQLFC
ncbi:uncharacterized protein [Euphorbia lathyris]|uniref:uncharacterized protein isoform X2 n=1 Tax=Euphorbia lathyris TaxID=212925 RepID=UPI0033135328